MLTSVKPSSDVLDIPIALRDSVGTLLGPRPHVETVFETALSSTAREIAIQKGALIAYGEKVAALIHVLEGIAKAPASESGRRKPRESKETASRLLIVRLLQQTPTCSVCC